MSLKTRLRVSITVLVAVLVLVQSLLSLRGTASASFRDALDRSQSIAQQVRSYLEGRLNERAAMAVPRPTTLEATKALWESHLENDPSVSTMLEALMANSSVALEILVCGETGRILASSSPARPRLTFASLPDFAGWNQRALWDRMVEVFTQRKEYEIVVPLGVPQQESPIFTIRVIVSSVLLRNTLMPQVKGLAVTFLLSLAASILVAVLFSNVALRSLERLGRRIDLIAAGEFEPQSGSPPRESPEIADVQSKLNLLSEQFRGARADVVQLRGNIEQMLQGLQDAVLLFDQNYRVVLAGRPAERLLGKEHDSLVGCALEELFPSFTPLGATIQSAVHAGRAVRDQAELLERAGSQPVRVLLNAEVLENFPTPKRRGVLVTLRDLETRRQLQSHLDISTRLAAINRLTSGVAHEIKNPLNAITLHLEILKAKLAGEADAPAELDVIGLEVSRLDRVVKTFLDFTRPVELRMQPVDLIAVAAEVASLVRPEAEGRGVAIEFQPGAGTAPISGDRDLLKQAILNVVMNGIEAMKNGGHLRLGVRYSPDEYVVTVADEGTGIPAELRDKIFNLYFTTKDKGSGIGLAMSFRVVQLHNATMEFTSEVGKGTTFRIRFPVQEPSMSLEAGSPTPAEAGRTFQKG